jgi:hypothetical protein
MFKYIMLETSIMVGESNTKGMIRIHHPQGMQNYHPLNSLHQLLL